jgi:hypothetical protein
MGLNSDQDEIFEEIKSDNEITYLEPDIKIENPNERGYIKNEVFEENNIYASLEIIGEKRKNQETANLEIKNKRIKDELGYKQEPQMIEEINFDDLNTEVIKIRSLLLGVLT